MGNYKDKKEKFDKKITNFSSRLDLRFFLLNAL